MNDLIEGFTVADTENGRLNVNLPGIHIVVVHFRSADMISTDEESGPSRSLANDTRRDLVERIILSSTFAKSERLSSLLAYVCDLTLKGQEKEINEQKIGEAVFGRSRHYDSSIDGIVRTQASRLRQRLDRYFNEEGVDEPVRIVIPRGGYVPLFEPRCSAKIELPAAEPKPLAPPMIPYAEPSRIVVQRSGSAVFAWSLVAILSIATMTILLNNAGAFSKTQATRAGVHPLWKQIFVAEQPILIVPGDSSLVMWEGIMNRNLSLTEYLKGDYRTDIPDATASIPKIAVGLANRRYTSTVDLEVVQALSQISQSAKSKLEVRYARDVRPNDLKKGSAILVGASEANPWVELFEPHMSFVIQYDRARNIFSVLNRTPQGNEPRQWNLGAGRVYAVVTYMPSLGGSGSTLILEGTSMAGTECAWDFVSDESQLRPFWERIRRADGSLPHFEVVLGTNNMSGSAVKSSILAWRAIN
jgi:hypothetical protein